MNTAVFLEPMITLIIWSLVIWVVLYARRIPAMKEAGIAPDTAKSPDGSWKAGMPLKAQAAAHNYNHLMEQPTIFYALMVYIVLVGVMSPVLYWLAWAYVGLRVIHSLVQVSTGPVMVRFSIFSLATICLMVMAGLAVLS